MLKSKRFWIALIIGIIIGATLFITLSCESQNISSKDIQEGTRATLESIDKQVETLQELRDSDEVSNNEIYDKRIAELNALRVETDKFFKLVEAGTTEDGEIDWPKILPLTKEFMPEEYGKLIIADESGNLDVTKSVTAGSLLLPPPWGQVLTVAFGVGGILIQEKRKRNKERVLGSKVLDMQAKAELERQRTLEIIASVDAMRKASPVLDDEIKKSAVKRAAWEALSPDTRRLISDNKKTA